jgi:capsular polysaccharide biosynthesis protein
LVKDMSFLPPKTQSGRQSRQVTHGALPADPFLPQSQSLVVTAIGRSKLIVFALAVLLAGAGVAFGFKREPIWSASSTLEVGANINPNTTAFSSFVQSETSLATTFSREITANDVLARIHRKTGLGPVAIAGRINATPVPNGAAINVIAVGPTARAAINLANVGAAALTAHESANNFTSDAPAIYRSYRAQATALARARARVQQLQNLAQANRSQIGTGQIGNTLPNPALIQAQADVSSAQARAAALSIAYAQAIENAPPSRSANIVTPLGSAVSATSDRIHKIELLGFIGLAGGFLIGGAIAMLREQRRVHRIPPP